MFFLAQDRRKGSVTNVKGRLGLGGFLWIVCESMHVKQPQPPSNLIDGVNTFASAIMSMALYLINSQSLEGVS